ncbi:MAG TPA: SIMPL domain-containing protein [Candidatus Hydrogenedentes bacterium]|nr:SIMPL domain-containing protein [Candidatus Hydrogenedentota bacterium]HQE81822.1 SIMPL domain-containing protein [Candidatus Hydrogenedentota bacterium]HQH50886.1 SIMPL domain-containing protein [Candidatus Hydrogenedentota bacterium]HQM48666.1 SIMPL domain-containing protein [Candidatus Hydrogenedentota bacterium]
MLLALLGSAAHAQDTQPLPASTITAPGIATIATAPDRAEFWLYYKLTGTTLQEAAPKVKTTEVSVLRLLKDREIAPFETIVTAPNIPDANAMVVTFALRLQFTIGRLATGVDEPVLRLAELCDAMRGVAKDTSALLTGPVLKVSQKDSFERSAIIRAMENALPHAEAAAQAMSSRIDTILDVRVVEVSWNQDPEYAADQPDSERAACVAKVEVVYVLE